MSESLYEDLKNLEGTESEPRPGNDRVNEAMIRHWCEATQDANAVYTDKSYAEATPYKGVIAPPTMIQAYCTPSLWPPAEGAVRDPCSTGRPPGRHPGMRSQARVTHQAGPWDCAVRHHPAKPDREKGA